MKCTKCGTDLVDGARFCPMCGSKVESSCSSCGAVLTEGARFCHLCGTPVQAVEQNNAAVSDWCSDDIDQSGLVGYDLNLSSDHGCYGGARLFRRMYYPGDGRIYFIGKKDGNIYSMEPDCTDMRLEVETNEDPYELKLLVNQTGIYTFRYWALRDEDDVYVNHYLTSSCGGGGMRIGRYRLGLNRIKDLREGAVLKDIDIYGSTIYYICGYEYDDTPEANHNGLYMIDLAAKTARSLIPIRNSLNLNPTRVVVSGGKVYMEAYLRQNEDLHGWFQFDLEANKIQFMNCPNRSITRFNKEPEAFDDEEPGYVEPVNAVNIYAIDANRGIMWTSLTVEEEKRMIPGKNYYNPERRYCEAIVVARKLGLGGKQPICPEYGVYDLRKTEWKNENHGSVYVDRKYYFGDNGIAFPNGYNGFCLIDRQNRGTCAGHRHGNAEEFQVAGKTLFLDLGDDDGDKVYQPFDRSAHDWDWERDRIAVSKEVFDATLY